MRWFKKRPQGVVRLQQCVLHTADWVASVVSDSAAPRTAARQAPLSVGFSRQEHWGGWPCPPPGIFLTQGWDPCLLHLQPWQVSSLPLAPLGWCCWNTPRLADMLHEVAHVEIILTCIFQQHDRRAPRSAACSLQDASPHCLNCS